MTELKWNRVETLIIAQLVSCSCYVFFPFLASCKDVALAHSETRKFIIVIIRVRNEFSYEFEISSAMILNNQLEMAPIQDKPRRIFSECSQLLFRKQALLSCAPVIKRKPHILVQILNNFFTFFKGIWDCTLKYVKTHFVIHIHRLI